MQDQPVYYIR